MASIVIMSTLKISPLSHTALGLVFLTANKSQNKPKCGIFSQNTAKKDDKHDDGDDTAKNWRDQTADSAN